MKYNEKYNELKSKLHLDSTQVFLALTGLTLAYLFYKSLSNRSDNKLLSRSGARSDNTILNEHRTHGASHPGVMDEYYRYPEEIVQT